jgi:hypothetical protein
MIPHMTLLGLITVSPFAAVEPSTNAWLYVISSTGGVAILTLIVTTLRDLLKGRISGKQVRNADMQTQRDTAWKERNAERRERLKEEARGNAKERNVRRVLDYAARLRRQLLDAGLTPAVPEPELEDPEAAANLVEK